MRPAQEEPEPSAPAAVRSAQNEPEPCTPPDEAALAPRMLDDRAATKAYLASFPKDRYDVVRVAGLGDFYLDPGDDVIKTPLRAGRPWEPHVQQLLRRYVRPGSSVIDAGAHIGTHTLLMSRLVGPTGHVYAFEPQKKIHRELVHNLRLNGASNVAALRFALGDRQDVITMGTPPEGNEGHTAVGTGGDRVELRTLDGLGLCDVSLLKIDVEGYESQVLRGAAELIRRDRPVIITELMGGHRLESAPPAIRQQIARSVRMLVRMGYVVVRIGVHDYLAVPATSTRPCADDDDDDGDAICTRLIPATARAFRTKVGRVDRARGQIVSTGDEGLVLFGPYEALPAGAYVVRWLGRVARGGTVRVDVVGKTGERVYAERRLELFETEEPGTLAVAAFTLPALEPKMEYRMRVSDGVEVHLSGVEIRSLDDQQPAPAR